MKKFRRVRLVDSDDSAPVLSMSKYNGVQRQWQCDLSDCRYVVYRVSFGKGEGGRLNLCCSCPPPMFCHATISSSLEWFLTSRVRPAVPKIFTFLVHWPKLCWRSPWWWSLSSYGLPSLASANIFGSMRCHIMLRQDMGWSLVSYVPGNKATSEFALPVSCTTRSVIIM